ncbi:hypothetical protein [Butyrivibrio sp. AE2015]|uniref:hypothetical protein n=1 Tax=Butyrivibrio sp. AE2015 TaxID=1280663 RepID=UPI0003B34B9C|nr:hypothetical protein [Butyrivibrio sp. AE2015]
MVKKKIILFESYHNNREKVKFICRNTIYRDKDNNKCEYPVKDKGVFCKCRALGYSCERPRVKSCIAAMCDHCIFTTDGLPSLLRVLVEYYDKFKTTGNKKYFYALNDHLIPYYADMIEELKADMSDEEKKVIDNIMGDYLECQKA